MRFAKILFISLFVILTSGLYAWAEDEAVNAASTEATALSNPQWQATIDQVTSQTKALLTENEKLNSEYEFLQEKVSGLKADLDKTKAEIKTLQSQKQDTTPAPVVEENRSSDALTKMSDLQKDIEAREAENKELEKQLADIQEKNRLWRIQLSTLENKKRDANLDVNYKEVKDTSSDVQAQQLDKSLQNEKDLMIALDNITKQNESMPKEAAVLKKTNHDLEDHIKMLKKQIAQQEQQNQKMQKSGKKAKAKPMGVSADLLKQKKALEVEIAKLSTQLDAVSKTVGESKEVLEKKRKLMDQIMHLDAENQELRSKIDALTSENSSK